VKKSDWLLLVFSAVLYALPFLWSAHVWWLIFIFPIPLLYLTRIQNLSFMHGFVWGVIVFLLHLSGGICVVTRLAGESWLIGVLLGMGMILYQALFPAIIFWCTAIIIRFFQLQSPALRLCIWLSALALFIFWTDQYCMWVFGIQEGYPLMHPLLPLAQQPCLLVLLPIIGKQLLTMLLLLVPASFVLLIWYKNYRGLFLFESACVPWLLCSLMHVPHIQQPNWYRKIKSLPWMAHSCVDNPVVTIKVVGNQLKKIIAQYPEVEVVVMPESAFNVSNFEYLPELLQLWNAYHLSKPIHVVFGTCRAKEDNYYNSLHWVSNGVLQKCFDKKHAMLITERLSDWMDIDYMRTIYFKSDLSIARSSNNRTQLHMVATDFVPYICSELFFNHVPDDNYCQAPIIAIVNDTLLEGSYIQNLLVLLARFRAMQWQRDIVYVSYTHSLFINKQGIGKEVND